MISTEPKHSYDPMSDIHSFNPPFIERPTRGRSREKSTIIGRNEKGITTIPMHNSEKAFNQIVELHSVEAQRDDLATHGLKELFEIVQDENIIDTGLITYADDHFEEKMSDDVESFIDEMLGGDRRQEAHPYDAMFDDDGLEETNIEGKVIIGKRETVYAVGGRKPQR